jgi:hypothetical protein
VTLRGDVVRRDDGKLYVRYETTLYHEPTRQVLYWAVLVDRSCGSDALDGEPVVSHLDLVYGTRWQVAPDSDRFWRIKDLWVTTAKGDAAYVERSTVDKPKVRAGVETRWNDGRWEKLLRKGWVAA